MYKYSDERASRRHTWIAKFNCSNYISLLIWQVPRYISLCGVQKSHLLCAARQSLNYVISEHIIVFRLAVDKDQEPSIRLAKFRLVENTSLHVVDGKNLQSTSMNIKIRLILQLLVLMERSSSISLGRIFNVWKKASPCIGNEIEAVNFSATIDGIKQRDTGTDSSAISVQLFLTQVIRFPWYIYTWHRSCKIE